MIRVRVLQAACLMMAAGMPIASVLRAESQSPPAGAVTLPLRDILDPDGLAHAESTAGPHEPPESREIRRPAAPEGGVSRQAPAGPASGEDRRPLNRSRSAGGWSRLGDFLPLATVLALIAAAAWGIKRFMPARRLVTGAGVMEVLARMPLAGKQSLVLVKLGTRLVLIGVSPERVNTVCIVDDPEQVALLIGRVAHQARAGDDTFGRSLDEEAASFMENEDPASARPAGAIRGLLERVRQLKRQEVA